MTYKGLNVRFDMRKYWELDPVNVTHDLTKRFVRVNGLVVKYPKHTQFYKYVSSRMGTRTDNAGAYSIMFLGKSIFLLLHRRV